MSCVECIKSWKESLVSVFILEVFPHAWYNFLRTDLTRNKFPPMYTNVEYTLVFYPSDNILWKLSSKLIENVWCSGTKYFLIKTSQNRIQLDIRISYHIQWVCLILWNFFLWPFKVWEKLNSKWDIFYIYCPYLFL